MDGLGNDWGRRGDRRGRGLKRAADCEGREVFLDFDFSISSLKTRRVTAVVATLKVISYAVFDAL